MTRVAVVTGAASGIGRAIAVELASAWSTVLVDRDASSLASTRDLIVAAGAGGGPAPACVVGDVSDPGPHATAVTAAAALGTLGGWVNCAGVTVREPLHELSEATLGAVTGVNQHGTLRGTVAAVRAMRPAGGAIVNVSSVHARQSHEGYAVYEMSKAAIEALTRNAAVSYGAEGIRVNAVAPGAVLTPALEASLASAADPRAAERVLTQRTALGRLARPAEIAAVVRFLLSEDAAYVTGQTIAVDAGWSALLGKDSDDPATVRSRGGSE